MIRDDAARAFSHRPSRMPARARAPSCVVVRALARALVIGFVLALAAGMSRAQEPKVGEPYTDDSDLGFRIRVPQKWELSPASPGDANLIAKYDPPTNKVIQLGKTKNLDLHVWLVKFDRRKSSEEDKSLAQKLQHPDANIAEWVKNTFNGLEFKAEGTPKEFQVEKIAATEYLFTDKVEDGAEIKLYAAVFKLRPDLDVAIAVWGPGDAKRWAKFEAPAKEMAHSFKPVPLKAAKTAAVGNTPRDKVRAKLQADMLKNPGWKMYETDHYFIVSNNDDRDFIEELKGRLEAIHAFYEIDYPAAKAKELRALGSKVKTGSGDDPAVTEKEKEKKDAQVELQKMLDDGVDPQEKARCSVVRVCKDADLYHSYGGPAQSAGYWNWVDQELVIYDGRKLGGKSDSWATLNHEAFHQYIFYFYGNISPHCWYNEGTGDFYAGYEYKNKKYTLKKFLWRNDLAKQSIQEKKFVPLKDFTRFTQPEYYGTNKFGTDGYHNYAQGWSFIYFLRTGKQNGAKNWNPKWDTILETYLRVLATSGKVDQAVEEAYQGIDWDALEASWCDYTCR
jgi:hypothetical protein